jgi:hypothetical protein
MKLRILMIFISFFGFFSYAELALANNNEDDESRRAILDLRSRLVVLDSAITLKKS